MQCSKCLNEVRENAIFCPKCGEFVEAYSGSTKESNILPDEASQKQHSKLLGGILAGLGIIVFLALTGQRASDQVAKGSVGAAQQPRRASAAQLLAAYQRNPAQALNYYGSGPVLVRGTVGNVVLLKSDHPVVLLKTNNRSMPVQVALAGDSKDQAHGINLGSNVSLLCNGATDASGTLMLQDCRNASPVPTAR